MPMLTRPRTTTPTRGSKTNLSDRLETAAAAKKATLERFHSKQADPALRERQASLKAISDARDARRAERQAVRDAEAARVAAEQAAVEAERLAREAEERR